MGLSLEHQTGCTKIQCLLVESRRTATPWAFQKTGHDSAASMRCSEFHVLKVCAVRCKIDEPFVPDETASHLREAYIGTVRYAGPVVGYCNTLSGCRITNEPLASVFSNLPLLLLLKHVHSILKAESSNSCAIGTV